MTEQDLEEEIRRLKADYQVTFGSPAGQRVLVDMAKTCKAAESLFDDNEHKQYRNIGRHEVWLHIAGLINLSTEDLFILATGRMALKPAQKEEENG